MWYEVVPTARGSQYRYSVIFSNEERRHADRSADGHVGPYHRHRVRLRRRGRRERTDCRRRIPGAGHEVPAFKGQHEGRHPLLWVSTDNNMVSETGPTRIRYAPMPVKFDLTDESREAVMDASLDLRDCSVEMRREGKIADDAPAGINKIADPRRFVFVEACGTIGNAALSVSVGSVPPQSAVPGGSDLLWTHPTAACRSTASSATAASGSRRRFQPGLAFRHPCDSRARVRSAAGCRRRVEAGRSRAPDADQQDVHARRALPAAAVDPAVEGPVSIPAGGAPFEVRIP